MNKVKADKVKMTIALSKVAHDALTELAEQSGLSKNAMLETMLRQAAKTTLADLSPKEKE